MVTLIVPACGLSTRFPGVRIKWLLTSPTGHVMIQKALEGIIDSAAITRKIFVITKHIANCYGYENIKEILSIYPGFEILVLEEQTESQVETIIKTIQIANVTGGIYIKDTDNYFEHTVVRGNYINTYDLARATRVDEIPFKGKCYINTSSNGTVNEIAEKRMISSIFGCGGYSFYNADTFLEIVEQARTKFIFISEIIRDMIKHTPHTVGAKMVQSYIDWGDLESWERYRNRYRTLMIDIDGVMVENSGEYGTLRWGESNGIVANIDYINSLYEDGRVQVILTTARPERVRKLTINQLDRVGLKYHQLVMGLWHAKRIIVNDYSATNPYKACSAINVKRNGEIAELVKGEL